MALEPDEVFINEMQAIQLDLKVKTGWILITGFGTIGSVRIVDRLIEDSAVANNVARIVPGDCEKISGFLAAFLSSKIGNTLLNERASGSVVRYIEAPEISNLPIPDLADGIVRKINSKYLKAVKSREISNSRLKEAESLMYKTNCLHKLSGNDASWFDEERKIESILVNSKDIIRNNHSGSEYRLDACFYNPMARLAIENIKKAKTEVKTINDVTERVFLVPRFKRNYVDEKYGVPFLSGKNIIQIRPTDLKYLSRTETKKLDLYYLATSWTLLTCSGTIGRTCFVSGNYENYTATQHILRVVPDETIVDPGYLYAF
ncbi:hypothetical protein KA005_82060, partial [bacterium]|nr:hypothetical protein [bacterium]